MRSILIRAVIVLAVLGLAWLLGGRQVSLFLDKFWTVPVASLPVSPLSADGSLLQIGELALSDVELGLDSGGRVMFAKGELRFPLGVRSPSGDEFVPDPGDEVALTTSQSALSWPTPFEFNFMTGHSPSWKRNIYRRLVWKKQSGAKLDLLWRYEQYYYPSLGWSGTMTRENGTGLIRIDFTPAKSR